MPSLDPRSPLVLDTTELGRRPGSMREVHRTVPAPADLGTEIVHVPEGSEMDLRLRLEAVMEGVLVSGTVHAHTEGECVRCLDDVEADLDVDVQELFTYPGRAPEGEDDDLRELDGDLIDAEPVVRDALVTALPFQPLCSADCAGLCPRCGARMADDPDHHHEDVDPRWAALQGLAGEQPAGAPEEREK